MKKDQRTFLLLLGDIVAIGISFAAAMAFGFGLDLTQITLLEHLGAFVWLYPAWIVVAYIFELYDTIHLRTANDIAVRVLRASLALVAVSIAFFYLNPSLQITPKTNLVFHVLVFGILLFWWRFAFSRLSRQLALRTVVLDPANQLADLVTEITQNKQLGLGAPAHITSISQIPEEFDVLIFDANTLPDNELERVHVLPQTHLDVITAYELLFQRIPVEHINARWAVEHIHDRTPLYYQFIKQIGYRAVAGIVLVIFSPLLLLAMLAILIEDGAPLFYTQQRIGVRNKPVRIHKLRTMSHQASKSRAWWPTKNGKDSRITRVGRVLRKLHIDELPQMWDVLCGRLELVGPRAEAYDYFATFSEQIPFYYARHIMSPGFTGWAQVRFFYSYGVEETKKKFEYDLYYLKNRSPWLDIAIMLRTVYIIIKH